MSKFSNSFIGISLAFVACCLFGAAGTVTRLGIGTGANTAAIMIIQALVAAIIAWSISGEWPTKLDRQALRGFILVSIFGGTSGICMLEGYARLGVAPVAILISLYPGCIGLYLWVFEGQRPSLRWLLALIIALAGVVLVVSETITSGRLTWEYLFPITATLALATQDLMIQRLMLKAKPVQAVAWLNVFTAVLAIIVYNRRAFLHLTEWPSLVFGLLLGGMLYLALQMKFIGIARVGAGLVSLVAATQPVLAVVIAALVLREHLSLRQMSGVGVVVVALMVITSIKAPETRQS